MEEKFKLGKKWFWIGIVIGFFSPIAGLVYGISILFEKRNRNSAIIIIAWSIASVVLAFLAKKFFGAQLLQTYNKAF